MMFRWIPQCFATCRDQCMVFVVVRRRPIPALEQPQMSLSDARIRALQPREKPFKVGDAAGLYLLVAPAGGRLWRLN